MSANASTPPSSGSSLPHAATTTTPSQLSWRNIALALGAAGISAFLLVKLAGRWRRDVNSVSRLTGPGQFARHKNGTFWAAYASALSAVSAATPAAAGGKEGPEHASVTPGTRRQNEITTPQPLLDAQTGDIVNPGYARRLYWAYQRAAVRAPRWRVKEWDYYYIANETNAICLTFANLGFVGTLSVSLLSFEGTLPHKKGVSTPFAVNKAALIMMPFDKMVMHENSEFGTHVFHVGDTLFQFDSMLETEVAQLRANTVAGGDSYDRPEVTPTGATNATRAQCISSAVNPPPAQRPRTYRRLVGRFANMFTDINGDDAPLAFDITLSNEPEDTMVIATPFTKKRHFYYNQKINGMSARGSVRCGKTIDWSFAHGKTSEQALPTATGLGTLDWGRGVWTYNNTWYWASLQVRLDSPGVRLLDAHNNPVRRASLSASDGIATEDTPDHNNTFAFNLGYGFGDTTAASENMLFFKGVGHKLDEVRFLIPSKSGRDDGAEDGFVGAGDWIVTSSDNRLELRFDPLFDRQDPVDLKVMCMIPHQVFGYFSGRATLDDGTTVVLDRVLGFAEKVHNRW